MRKIACLGLAAVVLAGAARADDAPARADDAPTRVTIQADWKAGDEIRLVEERVREKYEPGKPDQRTHSRTPLRIRVLEKLPGEYRLSLEYGRTEFLPPDADTDRLASEVPPSTLIVRLSEDGRITSLENWEAVLDAAEAAIKSSATNRSDEELKLALENVRKMFGTHDKATLLMTRTIAMYFYVIGVDVGAGEPLLTENWTDNPFGGERIPTHTELTGVPEGEARYRITLRTRFDSSAARIIQQSLKALAQRSDSQAPLPKQFGIEDQSEWVFDRPRGWVVSAEFERTVRWDEKRQVDRTKWSLADDE